MNARTVVRIVALVLLAGTVSAQTIYKSRTDEGNVAYSDRPVEGATDLETQRLRYQRSPQSDSNADAQADGSAVTAAAEAAGRVNPEDAELYCTQAQEFLEQTESAPRLFRTNADGEREFMSDEQVAEMRGRAEAEVEKWC